MIEWLLGGTALAAAGGGLLLWPSIRERGLDRWLPTYLTTRSRRGDPLPGKPVHLILCIADHFEPKHGQVSSEQANDRVVSWCREYPKLFGSFRDSDNKPPQHTFFYPAEEYEPNHLDQLAALCKSGYGEVEVHLHHDNDTGENLRQTLLNYKNTLFERHGLLSRLKQTGEVGFAFIHGNWALDNSRPDGKWCGVNNELDILRETGCFVDMTLPSAPSPAQTRTINSIYYAIDDPQKPKSHDRGIPVGAAKLPGNGLLLIQGPLLFDWSRRRGGLIPRVENGCLQANQAPSANRLKLWLRARVQVASRPDWFFVKLHTHGAVEKNRTLLLSPAMQAFHQLLQDRAKTDSDFHFHYVTAREMTNLVLAAEAGWQGTIAEARDYLWKKQT